jgi:hypothetical protein
VLRIVGNGFDVTLTLLVAIAALLKGFKQMTIAS